MLQSAQAAGLVSDFRTFEELTSQIAENTEDTQEGFELTGELADVTASSLARIPNALRQGASAAEVFAQALNAVVEQLTRIAVRKGILAILNFATGGTSDAVQGASSTFSAANSAISTAASGVQNFSGGPLLVGEEGPELLNAPAGTDVMANTETRDMLSMGPVVQKLDEVARRVEDVEVRVSSFAVDRELRDARSEQQTVGNTEYDPV